MTRENQRKIIASRERIKVALRRFNARIYQHNKVVQRAMPIKQHGEFAVGQKMLLPVRWRDVA